MRSRRLLAALSAVAALVILHTAPAAGQVLVLPERNLTFGLVTPGGGGMPLTWNAADGRLQIRNQATTFDPRQTLNFRVNPSQQEAQINLGGTVTPAPGQLAGMYEATIVVYVVQTGN